MPVPSLPLNRYVAAVWRRNLLVWRRIMWSSLTTNVADPLLFLFAFGYGLGAVIDQIAGLSYLAFVVPGMMAYATMFASSFETTISTYARISMQGTWNAILATPVTLGELILGEALWATTKGTFAMLCVLGVGTVWGGIAVPGGALLAVPVLVLGAFCFACCGLAATAHAKNWDFFAYFFTFWVTPMFVFCGVFFEVTRFPWFVQAAAWLLPMTHLIAVVRPLVTATAIDPLAAIGHVSYLGALAGCAFWLARHRFARRIFD
ncbi:MAG: ABC transporter permease [Alphaproteobacteria bacterium]|nr:ABC transporter permease [Alphaproteobacteria bacterium]